ncbi:MAG: hypothetical protein KIS66_00195 [Fimbriimonadaceae bacterium]|nr:hypothetical protein [Fimbriimonadaceae bacterium]
MRRFLLRSAFVAGAGIAAMAQASYWAVIQGTENVQVVKVLDGTTTLSPPSSLPAEYTFTADGGKALVAVTSSTLRRANQPGTNGLLVSARVGVRYRIYTNVQPPSGALKLYMLRRHSLDAMVNVLQSAGSGSACASTKLTGGKTDNIEVTGIGMNEASHTGGVFLPVTPMYPVLRQPAWVQEGSNWYCETVVPMDTSTARSRSSWTGSGGTQTVVTASSHAKAELDFSTADIGPYNVSGTVIGAHGEVIDVEVYNAGGILQKSFATLVDDNGECDVDMSFLKNGTYRICVTAWGSLRKRVDVAYTQLGVTGVSFPVYWGDVDRDNDIDSDDTAYILSQVGKSSSDPMEWFAQDSQGRYPQVADLNRDGSVTMADHAIAVANLGLTGD